MTFMVPNLTCGCFFCVLKTVKNGSVFFVFFRVSETSVFRSFFANLSTPNYYLGFMQYCVCCNFPGFGNSK